VLEPPSDRLWSRLRDELSCTPGDLRRARSRVKRLARDLPAFDTVWIDAFVHTGRLTSFQARLLEADPDAVLRIGEFVLLDELGHGSGSQTWLARRLPRGAPVVLKRISLPMELRNDALERSHKLIEQSFAVSHPCLRVPSECVADAEGVLLVSRFVKGLPLSDLLVRRGRFPAEVVFAVARQLVDALQSVHAAGIVHGDIRRSHIRITDDGVAVLVETGVRLLVPHDITVHAPLALESYDGIAPELIGIGRVATPATDWYSLGCVLWQLLGGRPPFPMADPLAKLAAHQTRIIEDVCERAPDTPSELAQLIAGLTQTEPQRRVAAAHEFQQRAGQPRRRDRRIIATFRSEFDTAVPHLQGTRPRIPERWPLALTAGCLGAALAAALFDSGLRTELLSATGLWSAKNQKEESPQPRSFSADLLPLPRPSPDGTIVLTEPGPYAAATIRFPGTLTLRAAEGICPEILVRDQPLRIAASHWKCEGVRFRFDRMFRAADPARTVIEAAVWRLTWQRCLLDLGEPLRSARLFETAPLVGTQLRHSGLDGGTHSPILQIENSMFSGDGAAFRFENIPHDRLGGLPPGRTVTMALTNVLHISRGALISMEESFGEHQLSLTMRHVTLRDSGPLVECGVGDPQLSPKIAITADDCVFQPARNTAVLEYVAPAMPIWTERNLVWRGEGSVLAPNVPLLLWTNSNTAAHEEMATDAVELEGLAIGQVRFAGFSTGSPAESLVVDAEVPRRAPEPPGILVDGFGCY